MSTPVGSPSTSRNVTVRPDRDVAAGTGTLLPGFVHVPAARRYPQADRKAGVAKGTGQPVTQRPRLGELDDQAADRGPRPPSPTQVGREPDGDRRDQQVVRDPKPPSPSAASCRAGPADRATASAVAATSAAARARRSGPVATAKP